MRSYPTMIESAVLPKTTSLCGSLIVITLLFAYKLLYSALGPHNAIGEAVILL